MGDATGCISAFEMKKGEIVVDFKTTSVGGEISHMTFAKPKLTNIFYTSQQSVYGISRKGKEFFRADTNVTEILRGIEVEEGNIWISGEYILNHLSSGANSLIDKYFYMCEDKINAMLVAPITSPSTRNSLLACEDKLLRVMEDDQLGYAVPLSAPPTALLPLQTTPQYSTPEDEESKTPVETPPTTNYFLYGCSNGIFGLCELQPSSAIPIWTLPPQEEISEGGVNGMAVFDILKSGTPQVILGKDNGVIEVFQPASLPPSSTKVQANAQPVLLCSSDLGECITGVGVGNIYGTGNHEVVATTYSGRVASLYDSRNELMDQKARKAKQEKTNILRSDIEKLKEKVEVLKSKGGGGDAISNEGFKVTAKLGIVPSEAAYILSIESQLPIDMIALQSPVFIDLLDMHSTKAIISKTTPDRKGPNPNQFMCTFRAQESPNRMEIKIRTTEGQYGDLQIFVFAKNTHICECIRLPIKPLSLHERFYILEDQELPFNLIKIKGSFSKSDIHSWLSMCLPEVPGNPGDSEENTLMFRSTFTGTYVIPKYSKGQALIKSDNYSAITIIKDVITKEATRRKITLDIGTEMNDDSVYRVLKLLNLKFEEQYKLAREFQLIEGLKELKMQDDEVDFLSDEFKDILSRSDDISTKFKAHPRKLNYLFAIILDL